jgi:7,8-dihydroneopterin aldolase/epimerase/oxygenase
MADRIALIGLELEGGIGVHPHEQGIAQRLIVDVELEVQGLGQVAQSDVLTATIDYDEVAEIAREVVHSRHHNLIETVADKIARQVVELDARIGQVTVRVEKPGAVPGARTVLVEVVRRRGSTTDRHASGSDPRG